MYCRRVQDGFAMDGAAYRYTQVRFYTSAVSYRTLRVHQHTPVRSVQVIKFHLSKRLGTLSVGWIRIRTVVRCASHMIRDTSNDLHVIYIHTWTHTHTYVRTRNVNGNNALLMAIISVRISISTTLSAYFYQSVRLDTHFRLCSILFVHTDQFFFC